MTAARNALGSAGLVQEDVDAAEQQKHEALQELYDVRRKLAAAREKLRGARIMKEEAEKKLRGKSLDELDSLVTQLCGNLKAAYHNAPSVASRSGPSQL